MAKDPSSYPIWVVLNRLIEQYGPSPAEFIQTLGYRNGYKGLRRLEPWLQNAEGFPRILTQIATTYPNHADELNAALTETKAMKRADFEAAFLEECKTEAGKFRPYVYAVGSQSVPNGICIFGISGGHQRWTNIEVSQKILALPLDEQLAALSELMLAYKRRYKGLVPFFGQLSEFKFVRLLDHFRFDAEGRLLENVNKPFRQGYVEASLR